MLILKVNSPENYCFPERLSLKSTAQIEGEVQVNKLAVEPGATFNATCSMKGAVKPLTNEATKQTNNHQGAERHSLILMPDFLV